MTQHRFNAENTEGYDAVDLKRLNETFDTLVDVDAFDPDLVDASYLDALAEKVLFLFDEEKLAVLKMDHADLVKQMTHWEAEIVALPAGADRDHASRQFDETVARAAAIKLQIEG